MNNENNVIDISAKTTYLAKYSDPTNLKFVWSYEITIENRGTNYLQLLKRFWKIIDLKGLVIEVNGIGVVGLQPLIGPKKKFTYVSYCQLTTPKGTMSGQYEMQNLEEQRIMVDIPKFALCAPYSVSKHFHLLSH